MKRVKWNLCSERRIRFSNVAWFLTVAALILAPLHAAAQGSDAMSVWPDPTQAYRSSRIVETACHADQQPLPFFLDLKRQSLEFESCVEGFDHACESLLLHSSNVVSGLNGSNKYATFQKYASAQKEPLLERRANSRISHR